MPTHGSLTKAGKVGSQNPKIRWKPRIGLISKILNKNNYVKRFEKRRQPGQKKPERGHRLLNFSRVGFRSTIQF